MLRDDIIEERVHLGFTPHVHQQEVAEEMANSRFSVLVCHRRWGKTFYSVATLFNAALQWDRPDGQFGYIAPYLKQAVRSSWKYMERFANAIPGCTVNKSDRRIYLPNGNEIGLYGGDNPHALRGDYLDGVVMDELADMKHELWGEVVRPMLMDHKGWAMFIGTPRGHDMLFDLYNQAIQDPKWFAGLFSVDMTDLIDQEELDLAQESMSDAQYRQEMLCDFSASIDNAMITIDAVVRARERRAPKEHEISTLPKIIGVDVARFGDDRSVIQRRIGPVAMSPQVFRNVDNVQLAGYVMKAMNEFKPDAVFIDGGRGEGVIDTLRNAGYNVVEVNFGGKSGDPHYKNKRTEMYSLMSEWIDDHGVLPSGRKEDRELSADLVVPTYKFTAGTDIIIMESKDDMKDRVKRSPDCGDALALTFAFPVHKNSRGSKKRKAYDPFEKQRELAAARNRRGGSAKKRVKYDPWQALNSAIYTREPNTFREAA